MNIDDNLLDEAQRLTGVKEKTALIREGLHALIERESASRLARLGGSEPQLFPTSIRRSMILVDTSVWIDHLRSNYSHKK